jgi:alkylation response protein AidB-like acyl-CoA dehydrogenase
MMGRETILRPVGGLATAAAGAAAVAATHAAEADVHARLPAPVIKAALAAGFGRHFVPSQFGGASGGFAELAEAVALMGEACASSAWFASLTATAGRMAGFLPAGGQELLWQDGPDTTIVASLNPAGEARAAAGGWRISGTWPFISFVEFAQWALVLAPTGQGLRFFAVARGDYTIRETWSTLGMRATGSHTIRLDDVFVAAPMSFAREDLYHGRSAASAAPYHRVPHQAVTGLSFAAPILGAARGALAHWTRWARRSQQSASPMQTASRQLDFTQSAAEIDAAELLLARVAAVADEGVVDASIAARNARDCAYAARLLVTATDRLMAGVGTTAMADGEDLQRIWRDVRCAASHGTLRFSSKAVAFADLHLPNDQGGI